MGLFAAMPAKLEAMLPHESGSSSVVTVEVKDSLVVVVANTSFVSTPRVNA